MKAGDFVIGIDQSYERSIYEVVDLVDRRGVPYLVLLFRAYRNAGRPAKEAFHYTLKYNPDLLIRPAENFKKATETELAERNLRKNSRRHFRTMRRMLLDGILSASDSRMITDVVFRQQDGETHAIPITVPETPNSRRMTSELTAPV